jgi:hypothetical protein
MRRLQRALRPHLPATGLDRYGNPVLPFAARPWEPTKALILW